ERRWEELRRADMQDSLRREALEKLERSDLPDEEKRARREELGRTNFLDSPFYKTDQGILKKVEFGSLDEYEDEEEGFQPRLVWPEFVDDGVLVTDSGRAQTASLLASASAGSELAILGGRIQKLLELSFFDTAVREACLNLEHRVKGWLDSDRWGDNLVE